MKPFPKVLLLIPAIYGLLLAGAIYIVYIAFIAPGVIWINVDERHGDRVALAIPACFVNAGLRVVALSDIEHEIEYEIRRNNGPDVDFDEMKPAIAAVLRELEKYPDITLVEIEGDRGETVRILKRHGALRIEVNDDGDRVDIRVPEKTMRVVGKVIADL